MLQCGSCKSTENNLVASPCGECNQKICVVCTKDYSHCGVFCSLHVTECKKCHEYFCSGMNIIQGKCTTCFY